MKKEEIKKLEVGTVLYNGRFEGVVKIEDGVKVVDIALPVFAMSKDAQDYNMNPENWAMLDDD